MIDINSIVRTQEYDFIRTNPVIKDKIMFLTLGGSHAYGTNVVGSDIDIRGCALNSKRDLIGMSNFESLIDAKTDTTIYAFNKLVSLLTKCNPNTIEMLGGKPDSYAMVSELGAELINNRKMFLSRIALNSFGGYARAQLKRLENAIATDRSDKALKDKHISKTMASMIDEVSDRYKKFDAGDMKIYVAEENGESDLYADINLTKYPARDFCSIINELSSSIRSYDKLNGRNKKKDDEHLNKHAMHLVRLYLMAIDIFEKEEIITYREHDREFLLDIRAGKFQNSDGTYRRDFFDMIDYYEKKLEYASKNTGLPDKPNYKQIEEFVMDVNMASLK